MKNPIIILGANYIGIAAKEIFEGNELVVYGFLDDDKKLHRTELDEVTVLGATDDDGFLKLVGKKCEAFVAVDDNKLRKNLVNLLKEVRHVQPVNAIHKDAEVSPKAIIGHGNFVDFSAYLAPNSELGSHCLIHARATVGIGSILGSFVQIGPGAIISPYVTIEDEVFIGAGVTIVSGITIGKAARIGAGSVVIAPVKAGETVFGNPAKPIKS